MYARYKDKYHRMKLQLEKEDISPYTSVNELLKNMAEFTDNSLQEDIKIMFLSSELPNIMKLLLDRKYKNLEFGCYSFLNNFCLEVMKFCMENLKSEANGTMSTLAILLDPNKNYYTKKNTPIPEKECINLLSAHNITKTNKEEYYTSAEDTQANVYFIINLNFFGKNEGFSMIIDLINRKPGVICMIHAFDIFINIQRNMQHMKWFKFLNDIHNGAKIFTNNLTEEDIRIMQKSEIKDYMKKLYELLGLGYTDKKASKIIEKIELNIAFRLLDSQILEKKILGLDEINRKIDQVKHIDQSSKIVADLYSNPISNISKWVTKEYLLNWFEEFKVFDIIFGATCHPEIIKRSLIFAKFLYNNSWLSVERINYIWENALSRHDAYRESFLGILDDLISILSPRDLNYLFNKITNISYQSIDLKILRLIKTFTFINFQKNKQKIVDDGKLTTVSPSGMIIDTEESFDNIAVLYYLWSLWQENALNEGISIAMAYKALDILKENLTYRFKHQKPEFIKKCLENFSNNQQIAYSCELLQAIFDTFSISISKEQESLSKISIIMKYYRPFIPIFFKTFILFKKNLVDEMNSLEGISQDNRFEICQKNEKGAKIIPYGYVEDLKKRLEFLKYMYKQGQELFSIKQIAIIWNIFVVNAVSEAESEMVFQWFGSLIGINEIKALSFEILLSIFSDFILLLNPKEINLAGYRCFEKYFIYINKELDILKYHSIDANFQVIKFDLVSINYFWELLLTCSSEQAYTESMELLKKLYLNYKNFSMTAQVEFVNICINHIQNMPSSEFSENTSKKYYRLIIILIDVLKSAEKNPLRLKIQTNVKFESYEIQICVKNKTRDAAGAKEVYIETFYNTTYWRTAKEVIAEKLGKPTERLIFLHNKIYIESDKDQFTLADLNIYTGNSIVVRDHSENIEVFDNKNVSSSAFQQLKNIFEYLEDDIIKAALQRSGNSADEAVLLLTDEMIIEEIRAKIPKAKENKQIKETKDNKDNKDIKDNKDNKDNKENTRNVEIQKNDIKMISKLAKKLSEDWSFFQTFFQISQDSDEVTNTKIWELLNMIPLNNKHYTDLFSQDCTQIIQDIFNSKNTIRILYSLKILNEIISEKIDSDWMSTFVEFGGFYFLYEMLINFYEQGVPYLNSQYLEYLLKILKSFIRKNQDLGQISFTVIFSLIDIGHLIVTIIKIIDLSLESKENTESLIEISLNFLVHLIDCDSSLLYEICSNQIFHKLISKTLVLSNSEILRETIKNTIILLVNSLVLVPSNISPPIQYFWKLVSSDILSITNGKCNQYFQLALFLLEKNPVIDEDLLENYIEFVINRDIIEDFNEDSVLVGVLNLIFALLSKINTKNSMRLISFLYIALFDLSPHGDALKFEKTPPILKKPATRKIALDIIIILSKSGPEEFQFILDKLVAHHSCSRMLRMDDVELTGKSLTGYVGLRNFGCTCYMNSLMQQIYMMKPVRDGLLEAGFINDNNLGDNLLYQMQIMLMNLNLSLQQCFEPEGICHTFKGYDGEPINVRVQQDADEFMNLLFDKLEEIMKNTEHAELLRTHIGGTIIHQIKSCEELYQYSGERPEHFFRISLEIKNKNTLADALDFYIKEDILEGDNKYFCEQYQTKITVTKKCLLDSLSNTIIIHLKRFDFDYAELRRSKINDKFEFPFSINLKKWCLEKEIEDEYYEFQLVGIVIHAGSADSGHYYSYIKDRTSLKWFKFDDRYVDFYDIINLQHDCFGGLNKDAFKDGFQDLEHYSNAYMLVYERKNPLKINEIDLENRKTINKSKEIMHDIFNQNINFMQDSLYLDKGYGEFLKQFHSNFEFQGCFKTGIEYSIYNELYKISLLSEYLINSGAAYELNKESAFLSKEYEKISAEAKAKSLQIDNSMKMLQIFTLYAFELLIRLKNYEGFNYWTQYLIKSYSNHIPASLWLLNLLSNNKPILENLLFSIEKIESKLLFQDFLLSVLSLCSDSELPYFSNTIELIDFEYIPWDRESEISKEYFITKNISATARFLKCYTLDILLEIKNKPNYAADLFSLSHKFMGFGKNYYILLESNFLQRMFSLLTEPNKDNKRINKIIMDAIEEFILFPIDNKFIDDDFIGIISKICMENSGFIQNLCKLTGISSSRNIIIQLCKNNLENSSVFLMELASNLLKSKYDSEQIQSLLTMLDSLLLLEDEEKVSRINIFLLKKLGCNTVFEEIKGFSSNCIGFTIAIIIWWSDLMEDSDIYACSLANFDQFSWVSRAYFLHERIMSYNFLSSNRNPEEEFIKAKEKILNLFNSKGN